jgi:hypothetical protein
MSPQIAHRLGAMSPGVATAEQTAAASFESAGEMREVLTLLLDELDRDSELGGRMRAAHLSYRYVFPDLGLALNVISSEEESHNLRWSFSDDAEWEPRLTMEMSSEVANAYLQGRENLAIAMARGRIRCSGDVRAAITLLPINSQIGECYREVLERHHAHLLMG